MRAGTVCLPENLQEARAEALPPGVDWVRLGDTVLFWAADDDSWTAAHDRTRAAGLVVEERAADRLEDLHLVTQVGQTFQHEHPDVPVLVDKGRYLVARIGKEQLERVQPREDTCYALRRLSPGTVVFRTVTPTAPAPEPEIQTLLDQLSRADYESALTHLVGFPTRHSLSPHYLAAASWARDLLEQFGYTARLAPITVSSQQSHNVVADLVRNGPDPRGLVLVTAHLDSVNRDGLAAPAPGADDNASGAAGLLEVARVLAGHPAVHDLRLILFGGEEQGLLGSLQHVATLSPADRGRIRAVINMDMIATLNTPNPSVLLEGATVSQRLIDELAAAAAAYTSLTVQTSLHPFNSDHVPFIDASIPAVLTIEGTDSANGNVHTAQDTLAHIDYGLALQILRMNVATTAAALADP